MDAVKRIAGTSAGAITSLLLALKFSFDELEKLLTSTPLTDFMDYEGADTPLEQLLPNAKESISVLRKFLRNPGEYLKLLIHLHTNLGICEGTAFLDWISDTIFDKTKIKYFTFGDLRCEIEEKNEKGYKHLHIFGTKIGPNPGLVHLNSEDREWDDYIIADAVRVSMSIPFLFKPHKLYKRVMGKDGEYKRVEAGEAHYIDGGLINNLPIDAFDRLRYIKSNSSEKEKEFHQANKRVLAFNLYSPDEIQHEDAPITTFTQLVASVMSIFRHAENLIHKQRSYDVHRIVNLDNLGVKLWDFKMDPEVQQKMISTGESELYAFLDSNEKYYQNLMETSWKKRIKDDDSKNNISISRKKEGEAVDGSLNDNTLEITPPLKLELPPPFTKDEEDKIFSFGPKAIALITPLIGGIGLATFTVGILTLPLRPFTEINVWSPANRSLFRRKLTLLALDDVRFRLFDFLPANLKEAEEEFNKNEEFFRKCCQSELFIDCLIASNKKSYISFFKEKKLLKMEPGEVTYGYGYHRDQKTAVLDINWYDSSITLVHELEGKNFSNLFFKTFKEDSVEAFLALLDFPEARKPIDLEGNTILHYLASLMVIGDYYPTKFVSIDTGLGHELVTSKEDNSYSYQKILNSLLYPFVEALFKHGTFKFYLNTKNSKGETPLMIALEAKNWHLSNLLIASEGIDLTTTSLTEEQTILRILMKHRQKDLIQLFFKKVKSVQLKKILQHENEYLRKYEKIESFQVDPILLIMYILYEFNTVHLEACIANGVDLRQQSSYNFKTIFYYFAKDNQAKLLRLACEKLKKEHPENYLETLNKVVISDDNGAQKTALMIAAQKNNYEIVKYLIDEGVDYTIEIDGKTAFKMAPSLFFRNESYKILEEAHYQKSKKNYLGSVQQ